MTGWQKIFVVFLCFGTGLLTYVLIADPDARTAMVGLVSGVAGWMMRTPGDAPAFPQIPPPARMPTFPETPESKKDNES